jgi:arylsulfatase A-like enzyme
MRRPNLLFIMSDDHAAHSISAYGSRINRTPHLDRLAQGGMRMDSVFCTNSICTPSRAAILTGTYNHVNGVTTLWTHMDNALWTFPKALQAEGYRTGLFGKWHLGHGPKHEPTGFDEWAVFPGQGVYYHPVFIAPGEEPTERRVLETGGYVTDVITSQCIDFLERHEKDRPFALFCHHKAPHRNWTPDKDHARMYVGETIPEPETFNDNYAGKPEAVRAVRMRMMDLDPWEDLKAFPPEGMTEDEEIAWRYQRYIKDYLRVVASLDDNVGRLLDALDDLDLADDTIVVYTSDQGFFLGEHGWFDKRLMYEESLRMPFLIRYPRLIPPGSTNDDIVVNVDFAPTFLQLAGVEIPEHVQGRSIVPLLAGQTPQDWPTAMYYRYWENRDMFHNTRAHFGVRTKTHKLIVYYNDPCGQPGASGPVEPPEWELFDLVADPYEVENLIASPDHASVARELFVELTRLQSVFRDEPHPAAADGPPV